MASHPIPRVQNVSETVADHMDEILRLFKPGAKITILIRNTQVSDGSRDFVQTNDLIDEAIAALLQRKHGPSLVGEV